MIEALIGVVVAGATYLLGRRDGRQQERDRRDEALASKVADEYVALARPHHDAGPHALATLGLHALRSDAVIREAIREMEVRSGTDPWEGSARHVEDVDLVKFFEWARDHRVNFHATTVEAVAQQVRDTAGRRSKDR